MLGLILVAAVTLIQACGGGGDSSTSGDSGEVVIGLTDAEGDFVSYTVDVVSITLTRANGSVVETLPVQTRVDFAQYTDMTEFLTAATVPAGVYTHGTLVLDYRNADIQVENAVGDAVKVENILDKEGNPISTLAVSVRLEGRHSLTIVPGIPAHLTLDFDLESSNRVSFDSDGNPIQTVAPYLLAQVNPDVPKVHRLRGPLQSVSLESSTFRVYLRPFVHRIFHGARHFGSVKVSTSEATVYEIDGQGYLGQAGLTVLANMPDLTAVIVRGDLLFNPRRFEAREVYAGSSVPGGDLDVVLGSVIARSGDRLTVKGATLVRAGGSVVFNDAVTVLVADSTTVSRQLSHDPFSIDAISVGQRVIVFGTITNDTVSELELDAANGHVRMQMANLRGRVVGTVSIPEESPPFVVNLDSINGRNAALYDFSGTGIDAANDATPEYYEIATGALDIAGLTDGESVAVRGFVQPFSQAPQDFNAWTVIYPGE